MKRLTFIIALMLLPSCGWAADHYVRQPGTTYGTSSGNDWTNAFTDLPATLVRGDTYYVAGGAYTNGYTFDDIESGATYIYIKKANATDNSGVAGWSATFASDQAVWSNALDTTYGAAWIVKRGYFSFDGVTGSGTAGYGFKLAYGSTGHVHYLLFTRDNNVYDLIIKHIEFASAGASDDTEQIVISNINGQTGNYLISNNYAHDMQMLTKVDGIAGDIIEYNYFKNHWSSSAHHGVLVSLNSNATSSNTIFRYNIAENATNGTGGILAYGTGTVDNVRIYGNIFFDNTESGNGLIGVGDSAPAPCLTNLKFYNNTIVNQLNAKVWTGTPGYRCSSGILIKNNLYYGSNAPINADAGEYTAEYNYYNANTAYPSGQNGSVYSSEAVGNLFTNYAGKDFTLVSGSQAIDMGASLGSPYNIDFLGYSRPFGVYFDGGAYEYGASGGVTITGVPSRTIMKRILK